MKTYTLPSKETWAEICSRPAIDSTILTETVQSIMQEVQLNGDSALLEYTSKYDGCNLNDLKVSELEIESAGQYVSAELKKAMQLAAANIESFHQSQLEKSKPIETMSGVTCWRKSVAIEKVGLYIPGGTAPLFSTILMLGIPARIAGCKEIILTTPPFPDGSIHPSILYAAKLVGVTTIFKVGGAQAIAAMTYGTESIPSVLKILGPGNQYVTKAKELAQLHGVAIDMPAGPSEVLVIADETSTPSFIAADLLSQAEHGADSLAILLSTSKQMLNLVEIEIKQQLIKLPRKDLARQSLANSRMVLCNSIDECFELSNAFAPEHLIIASDNADAMLDRISNAGSVFIGNYSCESAGDYASGTNHTLPTNGFARNYSGVSVDSFIKKITFQKLTAEGIKGIGPSIEVMAEAEELIGHKNAVSLRLKSLEND